MSGPTTLPQISVVIACVNGLPSIAECLDALRKQQGDVAAEIIVVNCCQDGTADLIRRKYPDVRLLHLAERLGIPELRAMGMAQARGEIIAITEDHCLAAEDWFREILKAHELGYPAVGGAVENASVSRLVDWAVYLCEYSPLMRPIPSGEVGGIAGNNAAYRREVLTALDESLKKNYWEFFIHEEMKKGGVKFFSVPTMVVFHKKSFSFLYFLSQRFHYSRSFAAMRKTRVSLARRFCYLASSPLLPLLMIWRMGQQVFHKKRHQKEFVLSLPLLAMFMVSYAFGEFWGYLAGPGESLSKVE